MNTPKTTLSLAQRRAVAEYERCLREEDRYLGSVFANAVGQARVEAATRLAYERAKALGVAHLC